MNAISSPSKPVISFAKDLDQLLGGGFKPGIIYELIGSPGTGKSTLVQQLAINIMLPSLVDSRFHSGKSIIIDTEGSFSPQRISEIAFHCRDFLCRRLREACRRDPSALDAVCASISLVYF